MGKGAINEKGRGYKHRRGKKWEGRIKENIYEEDNKSLEAELRAFEQYWRKGVADQARINEVVKEMAKMAIKQREAEGDDIGHDQLSKYWQKLKILLPQGANINISNYPFHAHTIKK